MLYDYVLRCLAYRSNSAVVLSVIVDATTQVNVYELLVELLESTGADRLEAEDPARLRAGAEAKLAEITEVLLLIRYFAQELYRMSSLPADDSACMAELRMQLVIAGTRPQVNQDGIAAGADHSSRS